MQDFLQYLGSLCGKGEIISIAYAGGSRPGTSREILPLSCTTTDLAAVEPPLRNKKTYKICKIMWIKVAGGDLVINKQAANSPEINDVPKFETLESYVEHLRDELVSRGWWIQEDHGFLGVGEYFKNGKPKKTPSVLIQFMNRGIEEILDFENGDIIEVERSLNGRERPWSVCSSNMSVARTFKELHTAMKLFIKEVEALSPHKAK